MSAFRAQAWSTRWYLKTGHEMALSPADWSTNPYDTSGCYDTSGWELITEAPFVHFSVRDIFDFAKVLIRFFKSHWYLISVYLSTTYECPPLYRFWLSVDPNRTFSRTDVLMIQGRWHTKAVLTPLEKYTPHFMMMSSNGNIFSITVPLCGEFTGHRWIPSQRPVTQSFDVYFDLRLNKRLSKQLWGWWLETLSCPLWRHCNVMQCCCNITVNFSYALF